MSSRENTHYLFEILKSPDFRIIDGHIYFGNNIVKLRYDLIRRAEQYSLSTVAVLYKDVLKLEQLDDQVNAYMPLLASKFKKLVYFTQNKIEFKPKWMFIMPYLHERRIYLNRYSRKTYDDKQQQFYHTTLDNNGKIAVATSTGGKGFEIPGRISDSATVAGNYANEFCGVSLTGVGEDIVSNATAAKIVTRVTDGFSIEKAFEKTFAELKPYDGFAGAIGIDKQGNIFHQDSHPSMVFASFDGENEEVFE